MERRENERERGGERQVESIVAIVTSPVNGKWAYRIAKVRLYSEGGIVQ